MRKASRLLLVFVLLAFVAGCASVKFKQDTYKAFYGVGTAYDVGMKSVRDLKDQGKISEAQLADIRKLANIYYSGYQGAVDAFEVYLKTDSADAKDRLEVLLKEIAGKLANLIDYINRIRAPLGLPMLKGGTPK